MEPLYPQNILERHYPVLREQREKEERKALEEVAETETSGFFLFDDARESVLHENEPEKSGAVGRSLNTIA